MSSEYPGVRRNRLKIVTRYPEWVLVNGLPETQISRISGRPVNRAISVGSTRLLSRRSTRSSERRRSIPARDDSRFPRRFRAVIAGNGFFEIDRNELIMQFERLSARSATKDGKLSGISANKFEDKSSECNVLATGMKQSDGKLVKELSANPRWRRKRHLVGGSTPFKRFDELRFPCKETSLELELPELDRAILFIEYPREWRVGLWCLEDVCGRVGE